MRYNYKIILFAVLLIPLIFLNFSDSFQFTKRVALNITMPLMRAIDFATKGSFSVADRLAFPQWLVNENQKLNYKIDELEGYLVYLKEIEDENARLRELLNFRRTVIGDTLPAQVIGRDASQWRSSLMLNKGKKDGITEDMPVVTAYGLVGMIVEVGAHLSRMILITDRAFKVSTLLQSSRVEGIVQGHGQGKAVMHYVDAKADIYPTDVVITSGFGGVFPKGLIVGGVKSVSQTRNKLFKEVAITPSIIFSSLEEVLIMINTREA